MKEKLNIAQKNELIAEYMGVTYKQDPKTGLKLWNLPHTYGMTRASLPYNKGWDLLMPVIAKIRVDAIFTKSAILKSKYANIINNLQLISIHNTFENTVRYILQLKEENV